MTLWDDDLNQVIYCRLEDRFEWIDTLSPFTADGDRTASLEDCDWDWSDLVPDGDEGWEWLCLRLIGLTDDEERTEIERALNPVFIDGFHVVHVQNNPGVHRGFRVVNSDGSPRVRKPHIHNYANQSQDTQFHHVSYLSHPIKSEELITNSIHLYEGNHPNGHKTSSVNLGGVSLDNPDVKSHGLIRVYG